MSFTIRIEGLAIGGESPYDGQYVVFYDPRSKVPVLSTTHNPFAALKFTSAADALEYWRQERGTLRPDGQPDRPLTAWMVSIEAVEVPSGR